MVTMKKVCEPVMVLVDTLCAKCCNSLCAKEDEALVVKDASGFLFVYCVPCGKEVTK